MAVKGLQLDFGPTCPTLIVGAPPISGARHKRNFKFVEELPEKGGYVASSHISAKVWCGENEASSPEEGESGGGLPEFLCQELFYDPTDRWDNRWTDKTPLHPDFRHKDFLWVNTWYRPAWVNPQVVMLDAQVAAGMRKPPGTVSSLVVQGRARRVGQYETDLEIATCSKLCEDGQVTEAVDALNLLVQGGRRIPDNLFYLLLKRCIAQKDLVLGRRIHALTVESGYGGNAFLATQLIGLFASHGRLEEAMRVFSHVTPPSAHNWAAIILAYARNGQPTKAIELYGQMREAAVKPHNPTFVAVLKACASAGDLAAGKDVHAHIRASEVEPDMFVHNSLVHMYAKCGSLGDARRLFETLPHRDVVTWNAMIAGYAQQGMGEEALSLYCSMQQNGKTSPSYVTFVSLLQACASVGVAALQQGRQLHAQIEKRGLQADVVVGNSLVNMYAKCGSLEDAQRMFDTFPQKTVVTWNAMISGYAQQGRGQEALGLYNSMQHEGIAPPNSVTFICLLQACARLADLQKGRQLHAQIEERGLEADVGNSLVNMYAKCGSLEDARRVFDRQSEKDVVTWTAMIEGYVEGGSHQEALSLYSSMQQEGISPRYSITFVCLLQACAGVGVAALQQGKQIHTQIRERGLQAHAVVGASLVNMYAQCGSLEDAERMFARIPKKDVVTWNAMIAGYVHQGMGKEALSLHSSMQQEGMTPPNSFTFACLLEACASVGVAALQQGKQLHAQIRERRLQADVVLGNNLVYMYSKCGNLEDPDLKDV